MQGKWRKGACARSHLPLSRPSGGKVGVPGARRGASLWRPRERDGPPPAAARPRARPAAARRGGATGPGTGQRIPGRRARCPLVTPGPRCAGVNDRRRRSAAGAARSAGGPGRPLSRHHIALSPSNTPRAPRLAGPRPRPHAPASGLGAGPGLRVRPSVPSLCAPRARADEPQSGLAWPGARRAPAPLAEPRCRRGGSVVVPVPPPRPPVCTPAGRWERDTKRSAPAVGRRCLTPGRAGPKPAPPSVPPRSARPSTASSTGRGARAWPGAAGTEARRGPPRPDRGPLLPRSGSGGQGWASPRGRLGAALPRLSLDCGEE